MTFQHTLKAGDIITVKSGPAHLLIIRSERRISKAFDGDYWVDEIDCVEIAKDRYGKPMQTIQYTAPALVRFYFEGGCMSGTGKMIKDTDVKVVGTSKLTTYTTTTHVMDHPIYYGNQ